ncbi:MAG: hypothetical protein INH37_18585 [Myxococcaceae bacterium]|nr:hypothetical protein [Myxococcaceae bacterium]
MNWKRTRGVMACGLVLLVAGCPTPPEPCVEGDEPTCDAGTLPADRCNSLDEARSDPACELTLCQDRGAFLSEPPDRSADGGFYAVTLPGGLTPRSLLSVRGGYGGVPQTPITFSLNVLREGADGGLQTLASANDQRVGAAQPRSVEVIRPFSESNARLFLRVSDVGGVTPPRVDNRNPYRVSVCVQDDPDSNEPNDQAPTPLTLSAVNGLRQGAASGYLATNDDLDAFSFSVTGTRQLIYLRVSSTAMNLTPSLPYRLAFALKNPAGMPIAEGVMDNPFMQVDLSTARLAAAEGSYRLEVFGYRQPNQMTPVPGDLRLRYDVEVRVMPDLDASEGPMGNDTPATARSVSLALGTPTTLTGRLAFVPDPEWFRLTLPGRSGPAVLRYELLPPGGPGRYPPLAMIPTRQLRVAQEVTTGATIADRQTACATRADVCPRSFDDPVSGPGQLVNALCRGPGIDPPQCLLAERNEEYQLPPFRTLKNFVGAVPVPPGVTSLLLSFGDSGKGRVKYADDREWSLRVVLEDDPDEAMRAMVPTVTLGAAPVEVSGVLTHGYGRTLAFRDLNEGQGIRGPNDYDATETDRDAFRFTSSPAMADQAWQLEWTLGNADGGARPAGTVALELRFCEGASLPDGGCPGRTSVLAPRFDAFTPWYLPLELANRRVQFTQTQQGNATVIRVEPVACLCVAQRLLSSGAFLMSVVAVDRTGNEPIPFRVRQSLGAYPATFANPDGGATPLSCPGGLPDAGGGCRFQVAN